MSDGKAEAAATSTAAVTGGPQYILGQGRARGPKGLDAVRAYYVGFVASGAGFFESRKDRIVVDDGCVVTENVMRGIIPGAIARARGYDVDDVDGHYLVTNRVVVLWPFDEVGRADRRGLLRHE